MKAEKEDSRIKVKGDGSLGGNLEGLAPELEFGVDGSVKHVVRGLGVEGADRGMVADLLTHTSRYPNSPSLTPTHVQTGNAPPPTEVKKAFHQ